MSSMTGSPSVNSPKHLPAWIIISAFALLAGFITLLALGYNASQKKSAVVGMPLPAFTLQTFDNLTFRADDMRGKVVVINFWASWCEPCEEEAPLLEEAWQQYKTRGDVLFLGLDYVDTEPQARKFLKTYGVTYPNGPDLRSEVSRLFHVSGVPETFIFGPDGTLVQTIIGPVSSADELIQALDRLVR